MDILMCPFVHVHACQSVCNTCAEEEGKKKKTDRDTAQDLGSDLVVFIRVVTRKQGLSCVPPYPLCPLAPRCATARVRERGRECTRESERQTEREREWER